jgi:hypothetical protein
MLLRATTLAGIADGTIRVAFRRWRRPTVRTGGTLLTKAGQVRIGATPQTRPILVRRPVDPQHARRNPA